jgi:hypothetical protein
VRLEQLDVLGYDRAFFHIDDTASSFTYYTFAESWPRSFISTWDIIGLRRDASSIFEVRLMHIEEEMLNWPDFEALQDAPGYIEVTPPKFQALISFFESVLSGHSFSSTNIGTFFRPMTIQDFAALHYPQPLMAADLGYCYRYFSPEIGKQDEQISFLCLPHWSAQGRVSQLSTLTFTTFDRQRLEDPFFNPVDANGLGKMSFNLQSLEEFIVLLKKVSVS